MKTLFLTSSLFFLLVTGAQAATYRVEHSYPQTAPKTGQATLLQFSLFQGSSKQPLTKDDLQLEHEKFIHLIALDSGFTEYDHVHPEEVSPGVWQIALNVKIAGNYRIWLQFLPQDEVNTVTLHLDDNFLDVDGQKVPQSPVDTSVRLQATGGDFKGTVTFPDGDPMQHMMATLKLTLEQGGAVITPDQLDDYLGAKMHVAAASADKSDFAHSHPETSDESEAMLHFMMSGFYGIFIQFQYKGVLHTLQFGVSVAPME